MVQKKNKKNQKKNANTEASDNTNLETAMESVKIEDAPANPPAPSSEAAPATSAESAPPAPKVDAAAAFLASLGKGGAEDTAPKENKKKNKKKKKPAAGAGNDEQKEAPKVSAAGKLLLQRQQALKAEEERLKKLQEEADRKAAEEEARIAEEERLKEEAIQKKRDAKQAKKQRQIEEGTYKTKSQKAQEAKAAAALEALLASGVKIAAHEEKKEGGEGEGAGKPKRMVYGKKRVRKGKDKETKQSEEEAAAAAAAAAAAEAAAAAAEAEKAAAAAAAAAEEEDDGLEDWEKAGDEDDDWEMADVVVPAVVETKAEEEEVEDWEEEEDLNVVEARKAAAEAKAKAAAAKQKKEEEAAKKQAAAQQQGGGGDDEESSSEEESSSDGGVEKPRLPRREIMELAEDETRMRSPIVVIMGHVDTGKTKLLDKIRRTNVQEGEAGGITQQIGATFFPVENIKKQTGKLNRTMGLTYELPGLLVIDTPGHESFTNLRTRGSTLCDFAILVIDIMHGLEQQTLESLQLLRNRKARFVVALNKVDRCYGWTTCPNSPMRDALKQQKQFVRDEFKDRTQQTILALAEQGLNSALYWENDSPEDTISLVPTSAISGEGVPDVLLLLMKMCQEMMRPRLTLRPKFECTVLEVKVIEGLGTTVDCVLVNGVLHEGDTIVVCTLDGPVVTTVRALLTPQPMKEMRVKSEYIHHQRLEASMGVKLSAAGLEKAVAGTALLVAQPDDDLEELKEEVMTDMSSVLDSIGTSSRGVYVQASTLGALEALLEFLRTQDPPIPVAAVNIGPVHRRDVMRASVMLEHQKEFATILAFDVKVMPDARDMAEELGVTVFTADIIYHLFDQFTAYMGRIKEENKVAAAATAVFPCILKILPNCIFNKKDPIVMGVDVTEGILKLGTPLCIPGNEMLTIGTVASIERDHKQVEKVTKGASVAIKIDTHGDSIMYGRQFDHTLPLYSQLTRGSIDALKANFKDDLNRENWMLVKRMKPVFDII